MHPSDSEHHGETGAPKIRPRRKRRLGPAGAAREDWQDSISRGCTETGDPADIFGNRGLAFSSLAGDETRHGHCQPRPWARRRPPSALPALGWKDVLWRLWTEINDDRILLISAGAHLYLLLALFPFLAAFVSLYGFVADPRTIADHISFLAGLMPSGGIDVIRNQLRALAPRIAKR